MDKYGFLIILTISFFLQLYSYALQHTSQIPFVLVSLDELGDSEESEGIEMQEL